MRKVFIMCAVIFSSIASACSQKEDLKEHYDAQVSQMIQQAGIPFIELRFRSPEINYSVQCANPDFYDSVKIAEGTAIRQPAIMQAASLSKVVFSYIVMKAVQDGEIDLDTPLYKYTDIDRFKDKETAKKLTARMVLRHRSGLPNWSVAASSAEWPTSEITFKFPPDSCYDYSGEGFAFLQRAIEKIKGKDIETIAEEEVFNPLGMKNSCYAWRSDYDTLAVFGYTDDKCEGLRRHPRANVGYTLRTTAEDYAKFLDELLFGTTLKPEIKEMMFTPDTNKAIRYADGERPCDSSIFWGLGIGTENNANHGKVLWHWGDNDTFRALFILIPQEQSYLLYFTNSNHGHDIIDKMTALFFNDGRPFALSSWVNDETGEE